MSKELIQIALNSYYNQIKLLEELLKDECDNFCRACDNNDIHTINKSFYYTEQINKKIDSIRQIIDVLHRLNEKQ